jgi:hypothetical protein
MGSEGHGQDQKELWKRMKSREGKKTHSYRKRKETG